MRAMETEQSRAHLELERREINEVLAYGQRSEPEERFRRRRCDDFGPSHGFASLGDFYGQNAEGFWSWHRPRSTIQ
jgi:hypothetical protein